MNKILISDIMRCLENTLCDGITETPENFPIFNNVSSLMLSISEYTLKEFDDILFDNVILI